MTDVLCELKEEIDANGGRAEFARAVGIKKAYLSLILSGKRSLSRLPIETGRKISEFTGIPLDRLAAPEAPSLAPGEASE
jgi:transcriptional regulator with XRE-family HTH domain